MFDRLQGSRRLTFQAACAASAEEIVAGTPRLAMILDARNYSRTHERVHRRDDGTQCCVARVAAPRHGFKVYSETIAPFGPALHVNDLVIWLPSEIQPHFLPLVMDEREAWVGLIVATALPIGGGRWKIGALFGQ